MSFQKQYVPGTGNGFENLGHAADYKGTFVEARSGIRGGWSIAVACGYVGRGNFHLWPAEPVALGTAVGIAPPHAAAHHEAPLQEPPMGLPVAVAPPMAPDSVYEVSQDGECVVCFDRKIDCVLSPCGHVATCQRCAERLVAVYLTSTQREKLGRCPICRSRIETVIPAAPPRDQLYPVNLAAPPPRQYRVQRYAA